MTADGAGVVSHAGTRLLADLGDATTLTAGLGAGVEGAGGARARAVRGRAVVVAGDGVVLLDDLTLWNGAGWAPWQPPATTPSPRAFTSLAYDERHGTALLFGAFEMALAVVAGLGLTAVLAMDVSGSMGRTSRSGRTKMREAQDAAWERWRALLAEL